MRQAIWWCGCLALGGLILVAGCGERMTGFASVRLTDVERDDVFAAGIRALRSQGFRIAEADEELYQIETRPLESIYRGRTDRLSEAAVKLPSRVRRIARVHIRQTKSGVLARCRVELQRRDTAQRGMFLRQREFGAVPRETPIEQGEGMTTSQTTVWTDLRRDRAAERGILQAIREHLARKSTATGSGK